MRRIRRQAFFNGGRIDPMAPVAGNELRVQLEAFRQTLPQRRKLPGFIHEHLVAGRQRIDQGGFPRAGARRGIDHDMTIRLEDLLDVGQQPERHFAEGRAAVVHGRVIDSPQDPVRYIRRARNLQKMSTARVSHIVLSSDL